MHANANVIYFGWSACDATSTTKIQGQRHRLNDSTEGAATEMRAWRRQRPLISCDEISSGKHAMRARRNLGEREFHTPARQTETEPRRSSKEAETRKHLSRDDSDHVRTHLADAADEHSRRHPSAENTVLHKHRKASWVLWEMRRAWTSESGQSDEDDHQTEIAQCRRNTAVMKSDNRA